MAVQKSGPNPKPAVNVNVIHADGKKADINYFDSGNSFIINRQSKANQLASSRDADSLRRIITDFG